MWAAALVGENLLRADVASNRHHVPTENAKPTAHHPGKAIGRNELRAARWTHTDLPGRPII